MSDEDSTRSLCVQTALAEFSALRDEIANRSSAQHTLIGLNLTAIGGIGGFVLSEHADVRLLLLLPILSPALGLLFFDHAINIKKIGTYIGEELRPALVAILGPIGTMRYEEVIAQYEQRKFLRFLPFALPLFLMFAAVPIGCLVATFPTVCGQGRWAWVIWFTGLVMTSSYVIFWRYFQWSFASMATTKRESATKS